MDMQAQIKIRTKKLGVLIRDARLASRRNIEDCAAALNVTSEDFIAYEEGSKAPSLPELETLVYYLDLPINHFWSNKALSGVQARTASLNLPRLTGLRQRMIGALLRQERFNASLSTKALAEQTGISAERLDQYELGELPIPLPELEVILKVLGGRVETFFDQGGPVGQWMMQQKAVQQFLEMPVELQNFVCKPVNRPYLDLARKLSEMSADKLRSVAETILDITL
jgi:transcriptional regulator with XRE-family HTH domain